MRRCLQRSCGVHSGSGKRAVAALPRTSIFIAACRGAVSSRQREEAGTTPGGAGDGAGDGGEAGIGRALPVEAIGYDRDGVAQALIVAHQHRAGLEPAPRRTAVARQTLQEPQAFPIKAAKGPLLQAPSNHSSQQDSAQVCWWRSSEDHPPMSPQRINGQRVQVCDLRLDRGRVGRVSPHSYAPGSPALSELPPPTIRYTRSPSVLFESSLSPSFLRTTAARKPRTVCGCQLVARMTVAMVAPFGPRSRASTRACFEVARV